MTDDQPKTIGLLVEAEADARTVQRLVDRVLCDEVDWLDDGQLEHLRSWRGFEPNAPVSLWKQVKQACTDHGVIAHGKFDGQPGAPDARAARRALLLFHRLGPPDAIILVRDADNQPERLTGLRQARDHAHRQHSIEPERVAIGVAMPEREAWCLCGFIPKSDTEQDELKAQRQRLGFDPTRYPHRLRGEGKRNAKPVLEALTQGDRDREQDCLDTSLDHLREHGTECGLSEFLDELRTRVVPPFG